MTEALQITVTAPIVSFRHPLYAGVQAHLPCPPPSTVAGMLASMVGGWQEMPPDTEAAIVFSSQGEGTDLETYRPINDRGGGEDASPKKREFLVDAELRVWLLSDLDLWEKAARRPVWPMRLGRSQDLASCRARRVRFHPGPGRQGHALVPASMARAGTRMRVPQAISRDRTAMLWGDFLYAATSSPRTIDSAYADADGQAVHPLGRLHADHAGRGD